MTREQRHSTQSGAGVFLKTKIDVRQALRVYQLIMDRGHTVAEGKLFDGLLAFSDFDGYTLGLKTEGAEMLIFFHNKFQFDATNRKAHVEFVEKLDRIDRIGRAQRD